MADPATTSNDDLRLASCGPDERDVQVALFNRCFDKKVDEGNLAWRYDESPAGRSVCVLLRAPDGQPVCGFSYSPRVFLPWGDASAAAPCGQQGDVMTDPDWRKRGIASQVWGRCEEETRAQGWPMNWGYPNRRSASVFRKLGWKTVGVIRPLSFYFRADDAGRRERFADGRLRALRLPLDVRASRRRRRAVEKTGGEVEVRPLETFPEEVGELSERVEPRFALMVRRDKAFLDWRFVDAPSGAHRALGIWRDGAFVAYVVVQPPREGGAVGWVVDLLAPEERDVAAALAAGLAALEDAGASVARATAVDGSWWARTLAGGGFLAPKPENHLFVYTFPLLDDHPVLRAATDASEWYLCDGDRDDDPIG